ncbi:MAG TPA: GerMN domain-containing protein, partial [Actinomycetota bacterium]|nr:GerMN domain-containing protein [Actinomycetota bacterium]
MRAVLVLGLLGMVAGCGVPTDRAPRDIPAKDVPFGLLSTTTSTATSIQGVTVRVFLVDDDRLAAVERKVPMPVDPGKVLGMIPAGPTPQEVTRGLRTAMTSGIASARLSGGIVTVQLAAEFAQAPIREQILALGQLVYTATALAGVRGVEVSVDGRPAQVPT